MASCQGAAERSSRAPPGSRRYWASYTDTDLPADLDWDKGAEEGLRIGTGLGVPLSLKKKKNTAHTDSYHHENFKSLERHLPEIIFCRLGCLGHDFWLLASCNTLVSRLKRGMACTRKYADSEHTDRIGGAEGDLAYIYEAAAAD